MPTGHNIFSQIIVHHYVLSISVIYLFRVNVRKREIEILPPVTSGHYMYRQIIIQHYYVLSILCDYLFCVNLRTKEIISLYNLNSLFYITEITPSEGQWTLYVPTDNHLIFLRFAH